MTSAAPSLPSLKALSPQEWETLIDDYNHGAAPRLLRWTAANYGGPPLVDLSLAALLRKDFSLNLKLHVLVFLEEHSPSLFASASSLSRLLDTLRSVIQSPNPNESLSLTFSFKEQFLISTTSIFVTSNSSFETLTLEGLIELLLTIINRPNHGIDRQTRAVACECLRQLEMAYPCMLSEIGAQLRGLCQSERTHAAQSYVLLLAAVVFNVVQHKPPNAYSSFSNASTPLIPFNIPKHVIMVNDVEKSHGVDNDDITIGLKETDISSYRDLRRMISFLLEWPQYLTPFGVLEFMGMTIPVAKALELQPSLLKVQFSGLLYTYDPLLCHAFLGMLYLMFVDSFEGQEMEIARRLLLLSRESSQSYLAFRLLLLHWLLGLIRLIVNRDAEKKKCFAEMSLSVYPNVFDPLSLKSLKLDLMAYCSVLVDDLRGVSQVSVVKLFEDGLICVSSFRWLPPWSTETAVAFRTFHKFYIGTSYHTGIGNCNSSSNRTLLESSIFRALQRTLVDSTSEFQGLVPVIVAFIDRFLRCHKHRWLGECLLETFDECLLPKLKINYKLGSYFPILEKIAENIKVSPAGLLELLVKFMVVLIGLHGPDTGLKSWCQGSKVLGICRTMLIHRHSSSLFLGLSHLLAFTCLYFPDLEVRDNARIYLRMLVCVPGKKLRDMLNIGEQLPGISPSTQSSSFFNLQSPRHEIKKSQNVLSCIHLERLVPLLVKQSWSLSLPTMRSGHDRPADFRSFNDYESTDGQNGLGRSTSFDIVSDTNRIGQVKEPLRVMDSKVSKIVGILRKHFSYIPDFRCMPGLKIRILCSLRLKSEGLDHVRETNLYTSDVDGTNALPALYATVLKFSSSAPYGSIPSYHVPFLLGEPAKNDYSFGDNNSLDLVLIEDVSLEEESSKALVVIDLEPREPIPGLVEVFIETNTDSGEIIQGQLLSITVGMEDMFLKAIVPEDVPPDVVPDYYLDLFNSLWEACGTSSSTGRETFVLKGGKGVAAISGTRSVKLLEVPVASLIQAVEQHLAPYVVSVTGEPLVNIVKSGGIISEIVWKDMDSDFLSEVPNTNYSYDEGPLYLQYVDTQIERGTYTQTSKKNIMGSLFILIFLPPKFHLLFQMEVCDVATLVRIRTDHWPCLAYVDDLLEALFYNENSC